MNRRDAVLTLLALGVAPVGVGAQQQPAMIPRIGFLRAGGQPPKSWVEAFQQGLGEQGYVVGKNIIVEYRFTEVSSQALMSAFEELLKHEVALIVASGGTAAIETSKVTKTLPIVIVGVNNPVELGLVSSLGKPGGNITGLAITAGDLAGKRLELLREIYPGLKRVAVLWHPANQANHVQLKDAETAARAHGIQLKPFGIFNRSDIETALVAMRGADALLQLDDTLFVQHRLRIIELANSDRLVAIYGFKEYVESGGLISYGTDIADLYKRAATYVEKILKSAKPADLPVEQPTKFELAVNLKTAKALGIKIPQSVLIRADRVIE